MPPGHPACLRTSYLYEALSQPRTSLCALTLFTNSVDGWLERPSCTTGSLKCSAAGESPSANHLCL